MKATMQVGNTAFNAFTVTQQMQPCFQSTVIHPICSTWDMAHQFEIAARKTLEPHLEDGEQGADPGDARHDRRGGVEIEHPGPGG